MFITEEYRYIRSQLIDFLKTADCDGYHVAYYMIGQRDFSQDNEEELASVADEIMETVTRNKQNPYHGQTSDRVFSQNPVRAAERELAIDKAEKAGHLYMPESERFRHIISAIYAMPTGEEQAKRDRRAKWAQSFSGQFLSKLLDQIKNPWAVLALIGIILYAIFASIY